jgi:filamentous hemagglutinin family protein
MTKPRTRGTGHSSRFAYLAAVLAAAWAGTLPDIAVAEPQGQTVVAGSATFQQNGNYWTITAADGTIINYSSFDIAGLETVEFIQPDALSTVLNRVNSPDPTVIYGTLLANGQVYLVNPSGVVFGNGSVVDVAGLYAAAGEMSNEDFLNGIDRFTNLSGWAANWGTINGGDVHLIGRNVVNRGNIHSDGGIITMLAGNSVYLQRVDDRILVRIDGHDLNGPDSMPMAGSTTPSMNASFGVENSGTISNTNGQVMLGAGDLYALAIRNTGTVQAAGGNVEVMASDGLIHNLGTLSADSVGDAGSVCVMGPSILNDGEITADAQNGDAGLVELLSQNHTILRNGSMVSASGGDGMAHGGQITIDSYNGSTIITSGAFVNSTGGRSGGNGGNLNIGGGSLLMNGAMDCRGADGYDEGEMWITASDITIQANGLPISESMFDGDLDFSLALPAMTILTPGMLEGMTADVQVFSENSILVNAALNMRNGNNILFQANDVISLRAPISGANNITLIADVDNNNFGWVSFNVPMELAGDLNASGTHILLLGGSVTSGGSQTYTGQAELGMDTVLSGRDINFNGDVNTFHEADRPAGLQINGAATFHGSVGAGSTLAYLGVTGPADICSGYVQTVGDQIYDGPTTLCTDTNLVSTGGGMIAFNDTLDGGYYLLIETGGGTVFGGTVGGITPLTNLTTDGPGTTQINADIFADTIDIIDPAALTNDVTITATSWVGFSSLLSGNGYDVTFVSPTTIFETEANGFGTLTTDANGTTLLFADIQAQQVDFQDNVLVYNDLTITGDEWVNIGGTVNAQTIGIFDDEYASLTVNAGDWARFGGDIGLNRMLGSFTVNTGGGGDQNTIIFDGMEVRVLGSIMLNADGREIPALVATIAATNGEGIIFHSEEGDFFVGVNEKITSLGNLTIEAMNGSVTVNDTNAVGDLSFVTPLLYVRGRNGAEVLLSDGSIAEDDGAELIAGGSLSFTTAPMILGDGMVILAALDGISDLDGLDSFELISLETPISKNDAQFGDTVLDLRIPLGPPNTSNLAEALTREGDLEDRLVRDPIAVRALEQLAIYVRSMNDTERVAAIEQGRNLMLDAPTGPNQGVAETPIAADRLRRDSVLRVIDQYNTIFVEIRQTEDGDAMKINQTDAIRDTLAGAWDAYTQSAEESTSGDGFRAFLAASEDHADARAYLDSLNVLFNEMKVMGLTTRELRASQQAVLGPITPDAMSVETLRDATG